MSNRQDQTHPGTGDQAATQANSATAACPYGCPRCCAPITVDQISGLFSGGSATDLAAAAERKGEADRAGPATAIRKRQVQQSARADAVISESIDLRRVPC